MAIQTSTQGEVLDIGMDLDGVCYDFVTALREWIHLSTGRSRESMPPANCWDFWRDQWNLTLDEFLDYYAAGVNAGYIFIEGTPIPGAIDGLHRLTDAGHRLHIVTARNPRNAVEASHANTKLWLDTNAVAYTSLTFSDAKHIVHTDLFLDDAAHNYEALEEEGYHPWLYTQLWNEALDARRVHSWPEFEAIVDDAASAKSVTVCTGMGLVRQTETV